MQKYLLSLIVAGISFIGFSNASNFTITCNGTTDSEGNMSCSPSVINKTDFPWHDFDDDSSIYFDVDSVLTSNFESKYNSLGNNFDIEIRCLSNGDSVGSTSINIGDGAGGGEGFEIASNPMYFDFSEYDSCNMSVLAYYEDRDNDGALVPIQGVKMNYISTSFSDYEGDCPDSDYPSCLSGGSNESGSGDSEGTGGLTPPDNPGLNGTGDSEGTGGIGGIDSNVPGASAGFTSVLGSLGSVITEFIPYIVYIGIGILSVIIGFVAIKRLINWIRRKTFGSFS